MLAFVVGLCAGLWHLGLTALRARSLARGHLGFAMTGLPLAWLGPVLGTLWLAQLQPEAIWAVFPGLIAARLLFLRPLAGWVEGPWTS